MLSPSCKLSLRSHLSPMPTPTFLACPLVKLGVLIPAAFPACSAKGELEKKHQLRSNQLHQLETEVKQAQTELKGLETEVEQLNNRAAQLEAQAKEARELASHKSAYLRDYRCSSPCVCDRRVSPSICGSEFKNGESMLLLGKNIHTALEHGCLHS